MSWITDVEGVLAGHAHDMEALTGCTVVLVPEGAVVGVDVRGSAPGTRETDLMRPGNLVEKAHAIVLSGGSAYGLDAASGVMEYLEEKGCGFNTAHGVVPIVGAAVIYDLDIGNPRRRPDRLMGRQACENAAAGPVQEGNVGAGVGATVGKAMGPAYAMKGGLGTASARITLPDGQEAVVAALAVVNALGDVVDPVGGGVLAGAYDRTARRFLGSPGVAGAAGGAASVPGPVKGMAGGNTTVAVVATDVILDKEGANKVAAMAHDGLARAIVPAHTMFDGDTVFCLSTGRRRLYGDRAADITAVGALAAQVVAEAIVRAVRAADAAGGYPSVSSVNRA
ncbi:MAG: P1 family peptidase [Bacillota bacterium]|jgi:L-aminopeptidase/D-esterase-like protein